MPKNRTLRTLALAVLACMIVVVAAQCGGSTPVATEAPTEGPTEAPATTVAPTVAPTEEPTPTESPAPADTSTPEPPTPTEEPTVAPTEEPTPTEEPEAALDGKALLEERCTACHGLDKIEGKAKDEAGWRQTVERMVSKGAKLDADEQEAVIKYLVETYPE